MKFLARINKISIYTEVIAKILRLLPTMVGRTEDSERSFRSSKSVSWLNKQVAQSVWASLVAQTVKNLPTMQETWVLSLGWEDPLEKGMAITPVFQSREFHKQRSLVSYSPWGHSLIHLTMFSLSIILFIQQTFT